MSPHQQRAGAHHCSPASGTAAAVMVVVDELEEFRRTPPHPAGRLIARAPLLVAVLTYALYLLLGVLGARSIRVSFGRSTGRIGARTASAQRTARSARRTAHAKRARAAEARGRPSARAPPPPRAPPLPQRTRPPTRWRRTAWTW